MDHLLMLVWRLKLKKIELVLFRVSSKSSGKHGHYGEKSYIAAENLRHL